MQPLSRRPANPFALMLDPQGVLAQIEHSERLERLQRRVCRPLDKPMLANAVDAALDQEDADDLADDEMDGRLAD